MFECSYNEELNRVTIKYGGTFDVEDAKGLLQDLQTLLPKLKKGFQLLADLSSVEVMKKETLPIVKESMKLLDRSGIAEIIRIIPDPEKDIGLRIMSYFHYSKNVKMVTLPFLDE